MLPYAHNEVLTTGTDLESTLCSTAVWSEEPVSLADFASRNNFPCLARIASGQYRDLGAETAEHSSNIVFIQSVKSGQKIFMETVKLQPSGRHVISTGQKFSLPITYCGWFEVLSEDGKPIKPVTSVGELAALWPAQCIVRRSFRAIVCCQPDVAKSGLTRLDKKQIIQPGQLLTLKDDIWATVEPPPSRTDLPITRKRYLRCVDEIGCNIFLSFEQKVIVSPVAGPYNISGVHNVQSLLDKFRFPLIVRLVYGVIPTKLEKSFTSVFRLMGIYDDETAFILPLTHAFNAVTGDSTAASRTLNSTPVSKMVTISTREPLTLKAACNNDAIRRSSTFSAIERRCTGLIRAYMNSFHVLVTAPDTESLTRGSQQLKEIQSRFTEHTDDAAIDNEAQLTYDEIDDIYRYVREGGEPPPSRSLKPAGDDQHKQSAASDEEQEESIMIYAETKWKPTSPEQVEVQRQQISEPISKEAENYWWEEPIYEDIEKIRKRKRQKEEEKMPNMSARNTERCHSPVGDLIPVGNLRQLIKHFSMLETPSSAVRMSSTDKLVNTSTNPTATTLHTSTDSVSSLSFPPPTVPSKLNTRLQSENKQEKQQQGQERQRVSSVAIVHSDEQMSTKTALPTDLTAKATALLQPLDAHLDQYECSSIHNTLSYSKPQTADVLSTARPNSSLTRSSNLSPYTITSSEHKVSPPVAGITSIRFSRDRSRQSAVHPFQQQQYQKGHGDITGSTEVSMPSSQFYSRVSIGAGSTPVIVQPATTPATAGSEQQTLTRVTTLGRRSVAGRHNNNTNQSAA